MLLVVEVKRRLGRSWAAWADSIVNTPPRLLSARRRSRTWPRAASNLGLAGSSRVTAAAALSAASTSASVAASAPSNPSPAPTAGHSLTLARRAIDLHPTSSPGGYRVALAAPHARAVAQGTSRLSLLSPIPTPKAGNRLASASGGVRVSTQPDGKVKPRTRLLSR